MAIKIKPENAGLLRQELGAAATKKMGIHSLMARLGAKKQEKK